MKLETSFPDHPKLQGLSDAAKWWYLTLWCYAAQHETDGDIPQTRVKQHGKGRATRSLINAGLLMEHDGHYRICGYLSKNPAKADLKRRRAETRQRVNRWRNAVTADPVTALQGKGVTHVVTRQEVEVDKEGLRRGQAAPPAAKQPCPVCGLQLGPRLLAEHIHNVHPDKETA